MIRQVHFQNFKLLRDVRIDLEPLTVFVGPNGSGKSSVFEGIHTAVFAAHCFAEPGPSTPILGLEKRYTRGSTGNLEIECLTDCGPFTLASTPSLSRPKAETSVLPRDRWPWVVSPSDRDSLKDILADVGAARHWNLSFRTMASASYSEFTPPNLREDGSQLASSLKHISSTEPDRFKMLIEDAKSVISNLVGIRFSESRVEVKEQDTATISSEGNKWVRQGSSQSGESLIFDFAQAEEVTADAVSEGTLLLLGILTAIYQIGSPSTVMLDDIDHGLHPLAQRSLLRVLQAIMQRSPGVQILASTHSPYLLDGLNPEQIRLMTTDSGGYSACGRLADHPQFAKWKDEMAPGELWSLFGEKWIVEGGDPK